MSLLKIYVIKNQVEDYLVKSCGGDDSPDTKFTRVEIYVLQNWPHFVIFQDIYLIFTIHIIKKKVIKNVVIQLFVVFLRKY